MSFFPSTLSEWLAVVLGVGGAMLTTLTFVWRTVRAPLVVQINGLGDRVNKIERDSSAQGADLNKIDRLVFELGRDSKDTHERIGRMEDVATKLTEISERIKDNHSIELREISERLAKIETKLDNLTP